METVAAASYAGSATGATRSPAYCAAMSFSQSYRPKVPYRTFLLRFITGRAAARPARACTDMASYCHACVAGVQAADHILRRVGEGEHGAAAGGEAVQGGEPRGAQRPVRDRRQPGEYVCASTVSMNWVQMDGNRQILLKPHLFSYVLLESELDTDICRIKIQIQMVVVPIINTNRL